MTRSPRTSPDALQSASGSISGLGRAVAWTYAGLAITSAATLFVTGVAVRRLGIDDFGLFALITALTVLLNVFEFGLGLSVQRSSALEQVAVSAAARDVFRSEIRTAHSAYAAIGLAGLAVLGLVLLVAGASDFGRSEGELLFTALISGVSVLGSSATSALVGVSTGRRKFPLLSAATATGAAANLLVVLFTIDALGLVGLALGQFASVLSNRLILGVWIRRRVPWFSLIPTRPSITSIKRVGSFSLPLLVLSVGGHLVMATDLIVIGSFVSASAAGLYRIGSLIPNMAVGILYRGYDTAFPFLAGSASASQEETLRFLTRAASFVAGGGFGLLALLREDIVALVLGRPDPTASTILLLFAVIWLANVPVHGLALLLIARGRHRSFVPLVAVEVAVNVVMTLLLTLAYRALGAALATLLTLVISNLILLPRAVRHELVMSTRRVVLEGLGSAMLGLAPAALAVAASWGIDGKLRLATSAAGAAAIAAISAYFLLGPEGRALVRLALGPGGARSGLEAGPTPSSEVGVAD